MLYCKCIKIHTYLKTWVVSIYDHVFYRQQDRKKKSIIDYSYITSKTIHQVGQFGVK